MICKSCKIREVCKTYDFIKNIEHADITINRCDFDLNLHIPEHLPQFNNNKRNVDVVQSKGPRPDLRAIEKQVLNIPDKPDPVRVTCPTCGGETYDDDIHICTKCGKKVCSNCGTAADGQLFCKECWRKEGEPVDEIIDGAN